MIEKRNTFLILIICMASILLFVRLGDRNIGVDETWTVIFAENTLHNGYPLVTKTYNFFPDNYVPRFDSWFSYYVVAGFYGIFGVSNYVSRLPFALFGLGTLVFFYFFTKYLTKNRSIAQIATFLLATSYLFYIHARHSRYFSFVMFFVLLVSYLYLKLLENSSRRYDVFFIIANVIFFYTQVQLWAYTVAALGIHFLIFKFNKSIFKRLMLDSAIVLLFCSPWIYFWLLSKSIAAGSVSTSLFSFLFKLALAFYYYFIIVFPIIFLIFLFFPEIRKKVFFNSNYYFLYCIIIGMLIFISVIGWNPLPEVRKIVSLTLPLSCIVIAHIIYILYRRYALFSILLVVLFLFSNALHVVPFYPVKAINLEERLSYDEVYYTGFVDRSLKINYGLVQVIKEVSQDYSSIHDSIFPSLEKLGLNDLTIYTDLDHNQLNYQSVKRGLSLRFEFISDGVDGSVYLLNYEENKRKWQSLLNDRFVSVIIPDHEDTVWQDSTNPIYRRYSKDTKNTMLLLYDKGLIDET